MVVAHIGASGLFLETDGWQRERGESRGFRQQPKGTWPFRWLALGACDHWLYFRPTQSIMHVPLQVNRFNKFILLIIQYKYLKSCSRRFYCPNLILRTRLCGTMFITEPSCLFYFHLTESVRRKWFVLAVYQFWKGISVGPALKYFTWFIGADGAWKSGML